MTMSRLASAGPWPPALIKAELRARGLTQAQIAREAGVSQVAVSHCIHGTSPHYKGHVIRHIIARHLRVPVNQIWPDEPLTVPQHALNKRRPQMKANSRPDYTSA